MSDARVSWRPVGALLFLAVAAFRVGSFVVQQTPGMVRLMRGPSRSGVREAACTRNPAAARGDEGHSWHMFTLLIDFEARRMTRVEFQKAMAERVIKAVGGSVKGKTMASKGPSGRRNVSGGPAASTTLATSSFRSWAKT